MSRINRAKTALEAAKLLAETVKLAVEVAQEVRRILDEKKEGK